MGIINCVLQVTKENLEVRHDDKEEAFDIRIAAYNSQAEGIREHYKKSGVLHSIDATKSMDEVYAQIKGIIEDPENIQRAVQRREALAAAPPAASKGTQRYLSHQVTDISSPCYRVR